MIQKQATVDQNSGFKSVLASILFVLLVFSATSFLPGSEQQSAISTRGTIAAGLKVASFILIMITLSPSVMIRGVRRPAIILLLLMGALFLLSTIWTSDPTRAAGKSVEFLLVMVSAAAIGQYVKEMGIPLSGWLLTSVLILIGSYLLVNLVNYGEFFHYRQLYEQDRVRLIFGENHPLVTARILYLGLAAILARSFSTISQAKKRVDKIIFSALFVMLWLTNARVLTGVLMVITLVVIFLRAGKRARLGMVMLAITSAAIGIILLLLPASQQWIIARVDVAELLSFNGRVYIWQDALAKISSMPIYGFGYQAHDQFLDPELSWMTSAHNTLIELFLSLGVIGSLLYIAILFANLPAITNIKIAPLSGILIIILIIDSLFSVGITMPTIDTITLALVGAYGVGNG